MAGGRAQSHCLVVALHPAEVGCGCPRTVRDLPVHVVRLPRTHTRLGVGVGWQRHPAGCPSPAPLATLISSPENKCGMGRDPVHSICASLECFCASSPMGIPVSPCPASPWPHAQHGGDLPWREPRREKHPGQGGSQGPASPAPAPLGCGWPLWWGSRILGEERGSWSPSGPGALPASCSMGHWPRQPARWGCQWDSPSPRKRMRFLAWLILGWILKDASMAAAACLFQKDGFSSSAGTGQHLSVLAHQHLHPWGSHFPGVLAPWASPCREVL